MAGSGIQFEAVLKPQWFQNNEGTLLRGEAKEGGRKYKEQKWREKEGEREGGEGEREGGEQESRVVPHLEMWQLVVWRNTLQQVHPRGSKKNVRRSFLG